MFPDLTLFCPVDNCCSEPAGWYVGSESIIIDVKTFSNDPKVRYHGTYNQPTEVHLNKTK
jgi:hypothetical protein